MKPTRAAHPLPVPQSSPDAGGGASSTAALAHAPDNGKLRCACGALTPAMLGGVPVCAACLRERRSR